MTPSITEEEYIALIEEIQPMFENPPQPGTPEAIRFAEVVELIGLYEEELPENMTPRALALISFDVQGIECDDQLCDFSDETVKPNEYKDWINRPCPKCGGNLLTFESWQMVDRMMAFTELTNQLAAEGALGFALPDRNGEFQAISLELDQAGIPRIIRGS